MKQEHKAATSVTIASTTEESAFGDAVQRYWKNALILFGVVAAAILVRQWMGTQEEAATDASWDKLRQYATFGFTASSSSPDELASLSTELGDGQAAPWAKALEVGARVQAGDYTGAETAMSQWASTWPEHGLLTQEWTANEDGDRSTLGEIVEARTSALAAWEAAHPNVLAKPESTLPPELQALQDQGLNVQPSSGPPGVAEDHDHDDHEGHDH